jgi:hypothetical protein
MNKRKYNQDKTDLLIDIERLLLDYKNSIVLTIEEIAFIIKLLNKLITK